MENSPYPQNTAVTPKTSGLAIASLVCGILGICLIVPSLFGGILGIIALIKINKSQGALKGMGFAIAGMVVSVLSIVPAAIMASLLLPTLAKAKGKANRLKCASNIGQISKSFYALSDEIEGEAPHLYGGFAGPNGNKIAQTMGYNSIDDPYDVTRWMSAHSIRQSLYGPQSLMSPADPAVANTADMGDFNRDGPIHVPSNAQSYAIAMQGDTYCPDTLMITTRNLKNASDSQRRAWYKSKGGANSEDVWKYPNTDRPWSKHIGAAHIPDGGMLGYATQFHGEDGDDDPKHTMAGMPAGQANWGTSDGAVMQGGEMEFNEQLSRAENSFREGNAISPGLNLTVLRPQQ